MRSRSTRITIASFASVLLLFGAIGGSMAFRVWGARGRQKRDREKIQNIMNTVVESSKLLKEIEEKKYETGGTKKEPDYVTKTAVCMYRFAGEKVSGSEPLMACIKGQMAGEPCFEEGEAHAVLLEEGTRLEMVDSEEFEIGEYAWLVEVLSGPCRGTRGWVFPAYVTMERTGEHPGMPGGD